MPGITLTQFVDFVITAGSPKLTKVREIKMQGEYNPASDFWKPLRDEIRRHPDGSALNSLVNALTDGKKLARYPSALGGYHKFLGRKELRWFDAPAGTWAYAGLTVRVNPEIAFETNATRYIVKLYFKDEAPSKRRLDAVFEMMRETLPSEPDSTVMAVLDVSKGRLMKANGLSPRIGPLLRGEAAAFVEIWNSV